MSALRAALALAHYRQGGMMLEIRNYYEQLVVDRLWKLLEAEAAVPSQSFLEDVACLALNRLPPRYVRHQVDLGSHLSESEYLELEAAVAQAVDTAMQQVRSRPHEDRE